MEHSFTPRGVCSKKINFTLDESGTVTNLEFIGGCPGNALGIAMLARGRSAKDIADILKGVKCGMKSTSCPAQLSIALEEAINKK